MADYPGCKKLTATYNRKKRQIKIRLKEFSSLHNAKNEDIFSELCFCILTPQSKAVYCDEAINLLKKSGILLGGCQRLISARLRGLVRFHNNKAAYIVAARKLFRNGNKAIDIKSKIRQGDAFGIREWLVENIKGLGYKEASHFLRNIGLGENMAILDKHILRNLKEYRVIDKIPAALSKKDYLTLENKMRQFSRRVKIPLGDLDLLFWSDKTGFIFK